MDMLIVRGGRPLHGTVTVSGSKNGALPIMAATLAVEGSCRLDNVPDLADIRTLLTLLTTLGASIQRMADNSVSLTAPARSPGFADYELVRRMRAGVCVLGPLVARYGYACVSLPGGCNIGHRPIDLHLKGLRELGARIRIERGYVIAEADRLTGAEIYLGGPFGSSVTGTCNVMTAAALARGTTVIEAAACEPEVADLGRFLIAAGARISGLGTPTICIEGVPRLQGCEHTIIPDRIEAATLLIAAAITRGEIELIGARPEQMAAVLETLRQIGADMCIEANSLRLRGPGRLRCTECVALPYPGIPTDVQAQLTALLAAADGISVVTDRVFPDRFMHVSELARMGARIRREGASAIISGPCRFSGASVMASDLRASAALVLAALAADGPSVIRRVYHLERGYERLDAKLTMLGADVQRVADEPGNMPVELVDLRPPSAVPAPHWTAAAASRLTPQR